MEFQLEGKSLERNEKRMERKKKNYTELREKSEKRGKRAVYHVKNAPSSMGKLKKEQTRE